MGTSAKRIAKPLIVIALLTFLVWLQYVNFKAGAGMDFDHYYVGAKMVASGQGALLHDVNSQFEWQHRVLGGEDTPFNYPAPMALLYLPVLLGGLNGGYLIWTVMSTVMFTVSILLLNRTFRFVEDSWFLVLICCAYLPVQATLATGQCDAFLLLVYVISLVSLKENKAFSSGLVLSLALVKFHLVLPFVLVMLIRRQWRFLSGFGVGAVAMLGVWICISGFRLFTDYPRLLMGIKSLPRGRFEPYLMPNLRGVVFGVTGHEAPIAVLAIVAIVALALVAKYWSSVEAGFAASIAVMFLTNYHGYIYDLILLLIPLLVAFKFTDRRMPIYIVGALLAIPIVPFVLMLEKKVWLLSVPIAILCWLLTVGRGGEGKPISVGMA